MIKVGRAAKRRGEKRWPGAGSENGSQRVRTGSLKLRNGHLQSVLQHRCYSSNRDVSPGDSPPNSVRRAGPPGVVTPRRGMVTRGPVRLPVDQSRETMAPASHSFGCNPVRGVFRPGSRIAPRGAGARSSLSVCTGGLSIRGKPFACGRSGVKLFTAGRTGRSFPIRNPRDCLPDRSNRPSQPFLLRDRKVRGNL